jgi:hypothetical protein
MTDVQESVSVPQDSSVIANAVAKLTQDIMAAKASGATGVALISEAVTASVTDLAAALPAVGGVGAEASAEPIGVAEAFTIAGFKVARALTGK